jgi:hypothetical protein
MKVWSKEGRNTKKHTMEEGRKKKLNRKIIY